MPSSGMLSRVALVRIDMSKELVASIIRVTRIGQLDKTSAVTRNRSTLRRNTIEVGCFQDNFALYDSRLEICSVLTPLRADGTRKLAFQQIHCTSKQGILHYME
jgi:hypothetical protein